MSHETPSRVNVANILTAVVTHGNSLDDALDAMRAATPASDAAFIQECVYGVLRRIFQLKWRLKSLLKTPLRARDAVIEMLLLAGLYELDAMQTPPYAVVDQSVTACAILGREWAKRLVNAILRGALRQANTRAAATPEDVRWNHPQWLIDTLKQDWPANWEHVLTANHARAPLTLRVNRQRGTRAAYLNLLAAHGIPAQTTRFAPDGVQLLEPRSVADLPGFDSGHVSVQDEAAQLAGPLLDCGEGQRVLDACMAPGGKASHLLELSAGIELTALERSARRALVATANFARLGLACPILTADVFDFVQDSAAPPLCSNLIGRAVYCDRRDPAPPGYQTAPTRRRRDHRSRHSIRVAAGTVAATRAGRAFTVCHLLGATGRKRRRGYRVRGSRTRISENSAHCGRLGPGHRPRSPNF